MKITSGAALCCLLVLASCQQAVSSGDSKVKSLTVASNSSAFRYYDLSTGTEVADPATQNWDIAFSSSTGASGGGVLTNSGLSAVNAASNGQGGVYYAGTLDFDAVGSVNTSGFDGAFAQDVLVWITSQGQQGSTTAQGVLNAITKLDFSAGDGLAEGTAFSYTDVAQAYAGTAYYSYNETTHAISASGEVYIIRHGVGTHYSKLQITSMSLDTSTSPSTRNRVIKYENF